MRLEMTEPAQQLPAEKPLSPEALREQVVAELLRDARNKPEDYARDSIVPEGGE